MKPQNHIIQTSLHILLIFSFSLICQGCEENDKDLRLRSLENETYFWENAKDAAQRLGEIMYHSENGKKVSERFKLVQISDPHLSDYEKAKNYMRSFNHFFLWENFIPSFACTGNHDCNMDGNANVSVITKAEIHEILFTGNGNATRHQPDGENYYYADVANPQGGYIRFIALDMLDQPTTRYNTLHNVIFSSEQIQWLIQVALKESMTDNHSVIILTHYPFQPYSGNASTYLCDGNYIHPWSMIPEIIEAFRGRTTLNKIYKNRSIRTEDIRVEADFSDYQGEFICYLGGHAHCDASFSIEDLENRNSSRSFVI